MRAVTMAIQGFQRVKANIRWDKSVVTTANRTHMMFRPILSTTKPNTGEAGAEMMYTTLQFTIHHVSYVQVSHCKNSSG